jgi:hypothetical protein
VHDFIARESPALVTGGLYWSRDWVETSIWGSSIVQERGKPTTPFHDI